MIEPIESPYINLLLESSIDWSIQNDHCVQVTCGVCQSVRMIQISRLKYCIKTQKAFTGLCIHCVSSVFPPPSRTIYAAKNPEFRHGRFLLKSGYVQVALYTLSQEDQELVSSVAFKPSKRSNTLWIKEHRLVMAKHIGRPLLSSEVVHHLNGIRSDNRLENLELLTSRKEHHTAHGDQIYQELQEALSENRRLRLILEANGISCD